MGEEKEHQENTLSRTAGQEVISKSDRSREEGRLSREAKGKQIEEKGRSIKAPYAFGWQSIYSK